jgi:hypothetical protein
MSRSDSAEEPAERPGKHDSATPKPAQKLAPTDAGRRLLRRPTDFVKHD